MKNKKIFLIIYISLLIAMFISMIVLSILGKKERIGYLSDFKINIDNTLEINGLDKEETKQLFTIDDELDESAINNYILTNESITMYNYDFRIKYYDKVFRNSDIYGVYPIFNNLPDYIQSAEMNDNKGTPFGNFVSDKIIDFDKIDNVNYILKLKNSLILNYIVLLTIVLLCVKDKIIVFKTSFIIIAIIIVSIILLSFLGKKDRIGYLSDFKININNTLEINGLDKKETKQLFTINDELDESAINNYILTNESITMYSYDFRIKYYTKIFRNSVIYDVYPNLDNLPNYVKSAEMNNRFGTTFGSLISYKELKYDDKIDTKYYLMINLDIFYYTAIIFIITLLCIGFYLIKEYWKYKITLDKKDIIFINIIELLYFILIVFKIWLLYPGEYFTSDTLHAITVALNSNVLRGHSPVISDLTIKFIAQFGLTFGEVFIVNTIIFYLSFCLITISLYLKYRNKKIVFLFLIVFISPMFFNSIIYLKGFIAIIYVFFSYSLLFVMILVPMKHKNILKVLSIIFLIIGMLYRHNFIVTVYPILIWFIYDYLKNKNIKSTNKYLFSFLFLMFINAIILSSIHYIFPRIFCYKPNYGQIPTVLYIQTVETLLNANDSSLIPPDMYKENRSFKDILDFREKNKNNLFIYYRSLWAESGKNLKLDIKRQRKVLFETILKHPVSYIKFLFDFSSSVYTSDFKKDWESVSSIHEKNDIGFYDLYLKRYPAIEENPSQIYIKFRDENIGIKFTELRLNIVNFLKEILPGPNILIFVLLSFLLFTVSGLLLIFKNNLINDMLILSFSLAFSSCATAIIIVIFGNYNGYRLIYPTMPISIISLIAFISFIYDCGGIKSFFKKLKTN